MRRSTLLMGATFVAVGALISRAAHALPIWQFDKMAGSDQDEYVAELVQGAERVLNEEGRSQDAQAVHKLFTTNAENGISIGMNKFVMYLALVRVSDADRLAKDPNVARLEIEHAMYIVLKKDGILLPKSVMHVMDGFKPNKPVQNQ